MTGRVPFVPPIVLGTTNAKKIVEIRQVLSAAGVAVGPWPADIPAPDVVEDGATFAANAAKKAAAFAAALGGARWVLSDDSGLEVDALGGRPGVFSHRYAGEPPDDARNNAKLLAELSGLPPGRRTARFRCALALARGKGDVLVVEGSCEGVIAGAPRGDRDFGYDPVFFHPPSGKTFAEMSPEEKHRVSHRGAALAALAARLSEIRRA